MTLIAALAALALFAGAVTREASAASRLLDRTFVCGVAPPHTRGGYPDPIPQGPRRIRVGIGSEARASWRIASAHLVVGKAFISQGFEGLVSVGGERVRYPGTVDVDRKTCRAVTNARIAFSRRGTARIAESSIDVIECRVPARIAIRVRANLRRPASLIVRGDQYVLTSTPRLLRVQVAVTSFPAQEPIAYAQIAKEGTAALYVSSRCARK